MPIKLTDIDHDDQPPAGAHRDPIGVVMVDDDGWSAACPSSGVFLDGTGQPKDLQGGITWIANRGFHDVRAIQSSQSRGDIRLRAEDWLRPNLNEMVDEWGLRADSRAQCAKALAVLSNRTMFLSFETVRRYLNATPAREQVVFNSMERSTSLASGMRNAMGNAIDKANPSDKKISARIVDAIKFGAFAVRESQPGDGEMSIRLRVPRLVHALDILSRPVPSAGKWKKADIEDKVLSRETVADLQQLQRPAILTAKVTPKPGVEDVFLSFWTYPVGTGYSRTSYTLEEVVEMMEVYDFIEPHVLVGPGWQPSSGLRLIESLIDVSESAAFAHTSWSVGVVAENILCGAMRYGRAKNGETDSIVSPESVWMAAYDRVAMLPLVRRMEDYGGIIMGGYAGGLRFKVPQDPEMASMIAAGAWENGLHIQMQTVNDMREMGVEPLCDGEDYGGSDVGKLYALMSQGGKFTPMWKIDEVNDKPSGERTSAFRSVLGL